MELTLNRLTTRAECDALLQELAEDKKAFDVKKGAEEIQETHFGTASAEVTEELDGLTKEIASITAFIATLPDGKTKTDHEKELEGKMHRKNVLTFKKVAYTPVELIEKQMALNKLNAQLDVVTDAIAKITAYKATLAA